MIKIPALKRSTLKQLQAKYLFIKSIKSDQSTTKAVEVEFVSVLKDGETYISGSEYETRLKARDNVKLGYQHMQWLLEHQTDFPELMALLGKVYIDFPALIVVDEDGYRYIPCVYYGGERWYGGWDSLRFGMFGGGRVAVSSKYAGKLEPLDNRILGHLETIELEIKEIRKLI